MRSGNACSLKFLRPWSENFSEEVQMIDINPQTLQALIDFCYTGEISITVGNVQSLLPAACLLQLNEIQVSFFSFFLL